MLEPLIQLLEGLWYWAGLDWDSLKVSASVLVVFLVAVGYALTGPSRYHEPASPIAICMLLVHTCHSMLELVPLMAIFVMRFACCACFGRALIDTVHENGILSVFSRSFFQKISLRKKAYKASDYEEWLRAETALEQAEGRMEWRGDAASPYYEYDRVATAVEMLRIETGNLIQFRWVPSDIMG